MARLTCEAISSSRRSICGGEVNLALILASPSGSDLVNPITEAGYHLICFWVNNAVRREYPIADSCCRIKEAGSMILAGATGIFSSSTTKVLLTDALPRQFIDA